MMKNDTGDATVAAEVSNKAGKRVLDGKNTAILRIGKLEPAAIEKSCPRKYSGGSHANTQARKCHAND